MITRREAHLFLEQWHLLNSLLATCNCSGICPHFLFDDNIGDDGGAFSSGSTCASPTGVGLLGGNGVVIPSGFCSVIGTGQYGLGDTFIQLDGEAGDGGIAGACLNLAWPVLAVPNRETTLPNLATASTTSVATAGSEDRYPSSLSVFRIPSAASSAAAGLSPPSMVASTATTDQEIGQCSRDCTLPPKPRRVEKVWLE